MSHRITSFRLLLAAGTALVALPAVAQTPPARVGQVAYVNGSVSFNGAGSNGQWVAATANYPVTTGDSLFTQAGAETAVVVDASRVTLAEKTELQITALDDQNFAATETQGEVFLNLTDVQPGQNFAITTPGGEVNIAQSGEYDILAGDASTPPTVTVLYGAADVGGVQVGPGQAAALLQGGPQLEAGQHDPFIDHVLAELAPPPPPYVPPVVVQMTGVGELGDYGTWDQDPDYGAVWYPNVGSGWAPYREGHWAFIAPWGWTWVDNEPWGFAPFHYGRWIDRGDRWGWVPAGAYQGGGYERPVYAPAVVSFFGLGVAAGITIDALSHGQVGWVPLAPGEVYRPGYHASDAYIRQVNRGDVRDFNNGDRGESMDHFANRGGATYVPAEAMSRGEPVAHYGHAMDSHMFSEARPVQSGFNTALRPQPHEEERAAPPPAFHPEAYQPPAGQAYRPPAGQGFHPEAGQSGHSEASPAYRPQAPESRPQMPQVFTAQPYHPQAPQQDYRPPAPQQDDRPQAPQVFAPPYHPQPQPDYRPQAPQETHPQAPQDYYRQAPQVFTPEYHPQPQEVFHPQTPQMSRPEAPRPDSHDDDHKKN